MQANEASQPVKVALYARVSTATRGENGKSQDPETQLADLRNYANQRNWEIVTEFVDKGISGATESRPQLDKAMLAAKSREFDVLLVWKFDRFARSVQHLLRALDTFNKLGIGFVSFTEGIDTNTPMGKFTLTVLGAVGELERSMIIERTKAGLRRVKANGKQLGIKSTIDIAQARALRAQGLTFAEIGTQLSVSRTA